MGNGRRRAVPLGRFLWGAAALCIAPASGASAAPLTPDAFFAFCASTTLAEAVSKGEALDWRRVDAAELASWTAAVESGPGVRARAVGFRQGDGREGDTLTFEVVEASPNSYRACSFLTRGATDIPAALRERYGAPGESDESDGSGGRFWQAGPVSAATSHVGATVYVRIATSF